MRILGLLPDEYMVRFDGDEANAGAGADDKDAGGGKAADENADAGDGEAKGDENKDAEGEGDGGGEGAGEDAENLTIDQLAQAKADKIVADRLAEAENARAEETRIAEATARAEETGRLVAQHKTEAATAIVNVFKDMQIAQDGKAVPLPADFLDSKVFKPMNEMLAGIESAYQAEAADEFVAAALDAVPEEGREGFLKATVDVNLTPAEWLKAVAEAYAPATKWAQKRALEVAEQVATAKAEGFEAGKTARAIAQPGMQEGSKRSPLTRQAFLDMTAEQQAKAYAERPDEVDALK